MADPLNRYRALLGAVDAWFDRVASRFPLKVACRRGCHDCCLGPFDVTPLDAALLGEGLAGLAPAEREAVFGAARDQMATVVAAEPRLAGRLDLAGLAEGEIDAVLDVLGDMPCPLLGPDGACRLYAHRPLVCRLNGIPLVDRRGRVIEAEGCFKNTLSVRDAPASAIGLDVRAMRKEERRLLGGLGGGAAGRFIAQAVTAFEDGA
jgi:Fe-S-cluster containining protein